MSKLEGFDKVRELIDENRTCMMVTNDRDGELRSRPMGTAGVRDDGTIWFFTDRYSGKMNEIRNDHSVNLAYAQPSSNNYLSVTGTVQIIDNQEIVDEMWSPMMKAWFPDGKDDNPRLKLLKVTPKQAEYWDASSFKLVELFKIGKAIATGEKYDSAEHEKLMVV